MWISKKEYKRLLEASVKATEEKAYKVSLHETFENKRKTDLETTERRYHRLVNKLLEHKLIEITDCGYYELTSLALMIDHESNKLLKELDELRERNDKIITEKQKLYEEISKVNLEIKIYKLGLNPDQILLIDNAMKSIFAVQSIVKLINKQ